MRALDLRTSTWTDLRIPLATPYRWSQGTQHERHVLLVRVGEGQGEVAPPPHEDWDAAAFIDIAADLPADATDLPDWPDMPPRLRCGLTTAMADAWAREAGVSVAQWYAQRSGREARASVAVNRLLTALDPNALTREVAAGLEAGIGTFKIKIGADVEGDLERVAAVRDAAPEARIRLDANTALPPSMAKDALRRFARYDIEYIEQPLPPADEAGLIELQGAGDIPVALDESAASPAHIERLLEAGAGNVVILKPQRLGGIDRTIEAMDVADAHGAHCVVTNSLETSIGVHASLHAAALLRQDVACGLATGHYLAEDVAPQPAIVNGRMTVPGPGLGVSP